MRGSRSFSPDYKRGRDRDRDGDRDRDRDRGGRDGGRSSSRYGGGTTRSYSSSHRRDRGDRRGGGDSYVGGGGGRRKYSYGYGGSSTGGGGYHASSSGSERKSRKTRPSLLYVDKPLLCQYLWQRDQELEQQEEQERLDREKAATDAAGGGDDQQQQQQDAPTLVPSESADANMEDTASTNREVIKTDAQQDEAQNLVTDNENNDPNAPPQSSTTNDMNMNDDANNHIPKKSQTELDQEYKSYNEAYCLKYVRSFFNQHLDDTWFRRRYSPLEYRKKIQEHRDRAAFEATCFMNEVNDSCVEATLASSVVKQEDGAVDGTNGVTAPTPSFVVNARLGGGIKPTTSISNDPSISASQPIQDRDSRKRKYSTTSETPHYDAVGASGLPKSHLFSFLQSNTAMQIMDVPSHVSEEHLEIALKEHAGGDATLFPLKVFSSMVVNGVCRAVEDTSAAKMDREGTGSGSTMNSMLDVSSSKDDLYQRNAWAIFESEAAKDKLMENLIGAYLESENGRHARDSRFVPKVIELSVDCSDPYGRYDIDADGKGKAPVSSSNSASGGGSGAGGDAGGGGGMDATIGGGGGGEDQTPRILIQRVSVFVSSTSPLESQTATVLSAAVSSLTRIQDDQQSVLRIANRLDEWKGVPREARLESILRKLFHSNAGASSSYAYASPDEDMLDVSIAYLRRVHLFTFYNGCTSAATLGNCLTANHPMSVIHLRLKGADEILQKAKEDHAEMYDDLPMNDDAAAAAGKEGVNGQDEMMQDENKTKVEEPKDMLVMRLDESIKAAIDNLPDDSDIGSPFVVNETVDAVASEIESLETKAKKEWIENHAMIDGDGRARCSFHFCRKLFKDESFLKKHLMKKHGEYLNAEIAKCHDSYMMKWWDEDVCRPVPPVLVDCGSKFGLVPVAVTGAADPCVQDPEPDLWREEQERIRREDEEEERYRKERAAAAEAADRNRRYSEGGEGDRSAGGSGGGGGGGGDRNYGNSSFVDVDDMKDEKVELSFSNVDVVQPPKKKKRKKKKLL